METKRASWASNLGFLMAAIGSAVGLGNIWGFPYKMGKSGGFAYLAVYALLAIFVGFIVMASELAMGRKTGQGAMGTYHALTKKFRWIGWLALFSPFAVMGFYAVLGGYCIEYMALNLSNFAFGSESLATGGELFAAMLSNPAGAVLFAALFLALCYLINRSGISGGIERACKVMIPALYVLMIILAVFMLFVPGTGEGYRYIFTLNPKGLLNPEVWVYAFGQCFFSLSVAGSGSVIYGSYLAKDVKIRQSAALCAVFDTSAALLAMLIIIPAMATVGADLGNGGPGLMFIYLLPVFNGLGAGISRVICIFFYLVVLFAGVSSIINLFETPVAFLQEKLNLKRLPATAVIHVLGVLIALMIQPWTSQWMDMVSIYLCPLGAFTAGVMFFWVMKKDTALEAAQLGDSKPLMKWFYPFGRYVFVPLCLLCFVLGIAMGGIG